MGNSVFRLTSDTSHSSIAVCFAEELVNELQNYLNISLDYIYVTIADTLNGISINSAVTQITSNATIGNIVNVIHRDSSTILEISLAKKLSLNSKADFNEDFFTKEGKLTIASSNSKEYYKAGDTIIGFLHPMRENVVDTSSVAIDSMLKKVDPAVRKNFQLDSVKK